MKIINRWLFLPIVLILVMPSQAQELDERFLNTLPENIQKQLESTTGLENEDPDKKYQNPDTRITNLEKALQEAENNLSIIKSQITEEEEEDKLKRFGENFFNSFQSTFLPINIPNASSNYVIDFGDKLKIQLIGQENKTFELSVNRDGSIYVPEVGKIQISGLTLEDASELIKANISTSFIGVTTFVSISSIRDMNVLIVGEIENPGMYTLSGGSSALSLIDVAGGINDNGSYRKIIHKRNNEELQIIDLYEVFLKGNLTLEYQLRSGDSIVVEKSMKNIKISGGVKNEAIFELLPSENLSHLLKYSGLITNVDQIGSIKRLNSYRALEEIQFNTIESPQIELRDGDSILINGINPNLQTAVTISISGEVNIPGEYTVSKGTKVSDLIKMAGGYTSQAYPLGGMLLRQKVRELEEELKEKSLRVLTEFIASSSGFNQSVQPEGLATFLILLKDFKPSGRVSTEFNLGTISDNPSLDRFLSDGDEIYIPSYSNDVYVFGEVLTPSTQIFQAKFTSMDYIKNSGGLSRSADPSRIVIIDPTGKALPINYSKFSFMQDESTLLPGSVIYVPRYIQKIDGINLASTIAPIISSFALSVASINSINQ